MAKKLHANNAPAGQSKRRLFFSCFAKVLVANSTLVAAAHCASEAMGVSEDFFNLIKKFETKTMQGMGSIIY